MADTDGNKSYAYAHGTVMIIAWNVFASTAILFSRYGRELQFCQRKQLFGESIWFQMHRLIACLATVITLLGFFFILVHKNGTWGGSDQGLPFVHSIFGGIIVCCALLQPWMALFRCKPENSHRFIYNWLHRLTGLLAFFLSIPAIFIIIVHLNNHLTGMIIILSLWTVWIILVVLILEIIQSCFLRPLEIMKNKLHKDENHHLMIQEQHQNGQNDNNNKKIRYNYFIFGLIALNFIVSVVVSISLIILIWR